MEYKIAAEVQQLLSWAGGTKGRGGGGWAGGYLRAAGSPHFYSCLPYFVHTIGPKLALGYSRMHSFNSKGKYCCCFTLVSVKYGMWDFAVCGASYPRRFSILKTIETMHSRAPNLVST